MPTAPQILVVAILALGLAGCASVSSTSPNGPFTVPVGGDTVPAATIGGLWLVEQAEHSGEVLPANARGDFNLEIDPGAAATAELRSSCGRILGSLSFQPNQPNQASGPVSFSLPGRAETECSPADRMSEQIVAEALQQVSTWSYSDLEAGDRLNRITLSGEDTEVVITRG